MTCRALSDLLAAGGAEHPRVAPAAVPRPAAASRGRCAQPGGLERRLESGQGVLPRQSPQHRGAAGTQQGLPAPSRRSARWLGSYWAGVLLFALHSLMQFGFFKDIYICVYMSNSHENGPINAH